jgi:hypothetical protein
MSDETPKVDRKLTQGIYAGTGGEIMLVNVGDLKVDHSYQRDLKAPMLEKMQDRQFDDATAGIISVSRRASGELYIVDGQHRSALARLEDRKTILAQVFEGLTPQQEADLRDRMHLRRADTVYEIFKARIFAGDPIARGMQKVAKEFDTQLNFIPDGKRGINTISTVEAIYKADDGKSLRETFRLIKEAWGNVEGPNATAAVIKGVYWFRQRHTEETEYERTVQRLKTEGVQSLMRMARSHQGAMGGSLWLNTYRAIVETYNYGLREGNKLEWRTSNWSSSRIQDKGGATSTRGGSCT